MTWAVRIVLEALWLALAPLVLAIALARFWTAPRTTLDA